MILFTGAVVSCFPDHRKSIVDGNDSKVLSDQSIKNSHHDSNSLPDWVTKLPTRAGIHFFVGESRSSSNKDEALENAMISAYTRFGMTEFPELVQLQTQSVETLHSVDYERSSAVRLEIVDWTGVKEATECGSPYIAKDAKGNFVVFRLLRWDNDEIAIAHKKIVTAKLHELPPAPAHAQLGKRLSRKVLVNYLNKPEAFQSFSYEQIQDLPKIRVGMKKAEVLALFGAPANVRSVRMPHVGFTGTTGQALIYRGQMCNSTGFRAELNNLEGGLQYNPPGNCVVGLVDGEVFYIQNFHYDYTEELK